MALPESSPINYFASPWAVLSTINILIFIYGLLCIGIVGLNRLSIIPVIVSAGAAVADGLDWYAWFSQDMYSHKAELEAAAFAYAGWTIREIGCMFYSYFILERILDKWQRSLFLGLFWTFVTTTFVVRVFTCVYSVIAMVPKAKNHGPLINILSTVMFTTSAITEIISAVFLIYTFTKARRNASKYAVRSNTGFFKHFLLSSELRVAALASIGIIRAGVMGSKSKVLIASQFDMLAIIMQEMFPVLLIMDQFATRLAKLEAKYAKSLSSSEGIMNQNGGGADVFHMAGAKSPHLNKRQGHGRAVVTVDTIDENFRVYMGAGAKAEYESRVDPTSSL